MKQPVLWYLESAYLYVGMSLFLTRSSLYKKVLYIIYIFVNFHFSSGRDGIILHLMGHWWLLDHRYHHSEVAKKA